MRAAGVCRAEKTGVYRSADTEVLTDPVPETRDRRACRGAAKETGCLVDGRTGRYGAPFGWREDAGPVPMVVRRMERVDGAAFRESSRGW